MDRELELHPELKVRLAEECFVSFGDATHSSVDELKDVEVLAASPEFAEPRGLRLPEGEVKYGYYHRLTKSDKLEASKWDKLLFECPLYIYDPVPAVDRIREHWQWSWMRSEFGQLYAEWWIHNELFRPIWVPGVVGTEC